MAGTVQPALARAGAAFTLDSLTVEDGSLLVTGHWDGVRGLRFVRPTLVAGGRDVLATLEHKPWSPDGDPWIAAFPWGEDEPPAHDLWLSVGPSVTVPLATVEAPEGGKAPASDPQEPALHDELRRLRVERDALREQVADALRDRDAALRTRGRMEAQRDEAFAERNAAERQRDEALDERDRALARRDEAVADREVAMRAHRKMQRQRDEAVEAMKAAEEVRDDGVRTAESEREVALRSELQAAEAAREAAFAERDRAVAQCDELRGRSDELRGQYDELRGQRDDALLAQRALQRRIEEDAAERDRARRAPARPADVPDEGGHSALGDTDKPLGVRTVPAARSLGADLAPAPGDPGRGLTAADRVAIRVFASVAALCSVLLLATLLRLFL